jgi:hypothetical protein
VAGFTRSPEEEQLFHQEELVVLPKFWQQVTGADDGVLLLGEVRQAAVKALTEAGFVKTLKEHFARTRPQAKAPSKP